ncbi:GlcG/HbpS family heme-binding protein [Actinomadura atramentaria]|uniref:GlcG/HbpS family heme-binding protein n=1 Tax=Actinomadura atramentaria TaxID=1990 RepID=UPI000377FF63|nr:heme-binding protein [Actinomadura atramentaria]
MTFPLVRALAAGAALTAASAALTAPAAHAAPAAPAAPGTETPARNVYSTAHLTVAAATRAARGALAAARRAGQRVSVAVVDRDGRTIAALRGDGSGPQSWTSARRKAFTAVSWNAPTSELVKRLATTPTLRDIPGTLFLAGAVPIRHRNTPIAAIGVAGAPSGAQDESFARAGAATITH